MMFLFKQDLQKSAWKAYVEGNVYRNEFMNLKKSKDEFSRVF